VARFNRFKRHELARQVRSLGLVTYRVWEQVEPLHEIKVHWQLRHARLFNQRTRTGLNYQLIPPSRVVEIINQARVGLILSEEEGANNATMEYLLCGLPVVSTESIGARDEFFDPEHVRVVPPNSGAVAEAVRDLASRRLNPHEIRESVLAKMQPHRERFIRYVQSLYNELQVNRSFAEEWPKVFKDKFRQDPLN
jgi:glycosyltransferase involved in cell wall biosynthesis